jgi:hypothetical protein
MKKVIKQGSLTGTRSIKMENERVKKELMLLDGINKKDWGKKK